MKLVTPDPNTEKVCGRCGLPVCYLDTGRTVRVMNAARVEADHLTLLSDHRCPPEPSAPGPVSAGRDCLPLWCLDRILIELEAEPEGLTTLDLNDRVFAGRLSQDVLLNGLVELQRQREVACHGARHTPTHGLMWHRTRPLHADPNEEQV